MTALLIAAETPPPPYGTMAAGVSMPESADDVDAERLLARIRADVATLSRQVLGGAVSDGALLESVEEIARLGRALKAEELRRVNELTIRSAAAGLGARSTEDLLAGRLGLTKGEAKRETQTAQVLDELPQTAERLRSGEMGIGEADTAAQMFAEMGVTDEATTEAFDRLVAGQAGRGNRRQLRNRLENFAHRHAPDRLADRDTRAHARRRFRRWIDEANGMWRCDGALPLAAGAAVDAAIDGIITRDQGPSPTGDHGDGQGACDGVCGHDGDGTHRPDGDGRTFEQKAADALVGMATQTVAAGDLPTVHGEPARVLLHVTDTDSPPVIDGAGAVSEETAQQLLCDAERRYVLETRNGGVLDVGRAKRDPTPQQRAAVIARDRVCIGCGTKAARCQIHHVAWYGRDKGSTDESNLVLVCWNCHHHVHHHGWTVVGDHISGFAIHRPETPDPAGGTRRRRTP